LTTTSVTASTQVQLKIVVAHRARLFWGMISGAIALDMSAFVGSFLLNSQRLEIGMPTPL
jgi:hypothetical protein